VNIISHVSKSVATAQWIRKCRIKYGISDGESNSREDYQDTDSFTAFLIQ
jgi:hypothetical protein